MKESQPTQLSIVLNTKVTISYVNNFFFSCRTVFDLKHRLERIIGIPAAKMKLYYVDQDYRDHQGIEEMKFPQKQLYRYNIRSGDEIIIDVKK